MVEERNFGYLGVSFQQSLIKLIIEDKKFATTILDVIDPHYFDNSSFRFIIQNIKELYSIYNEVPGYDTIKYKLTEEGKDDTTQKMHLDTLDNIKSQELSSVNYIEDKAMNFCKQQVLKRELKTVQKIIDEGDFDSYKEIEQIIQKALQVGVNTDNIRDVFDDMRTVIKKDNRVPIPTGIQGIDAIIGGLSSGEFGVILAPTGIGKTTVLTKIANTAYNYDKKVLQIIFEDNINEVVRKHYTIWTGVAPGKLADEEEDVISIITERQSNSKGMLKICKLPSDSVTIAEIKSLLRKLAMEGFKPDLIIIDYLDCIKNGNTMFGEEWKGEGSIMRQLEAMTSEFDVAIWGATQGNRESITTEVVTSDLMGGSIKKAQIAHILISIGKTLEQKENDLATITLVKSRVSKDGVVFSNCYFNNEMIEIIANDQTTLLGHEQMVEDWKKQRPIEVYREAKKKKLDELTQKATDAANTFNNATDIIDEAETDNPAPGSVIKPNTNFDNKNFKFGQTTILGRKTEKAEERIKKKELANAEKQKKIIPNADVKVKAAYRTQKQAVEQLASH